MRFRPLPVTLTLATIAMMFGLGLHIVEKFRETHLTAYSQIAEVYVEQVLAPFALAETSRGAKPLSPSDEIAAALGRRGTGGPAIILQVWGLDGSLIYPASPRSTAGTHDNSDLLVALSGEKVARIEAPGMGDDTVPFNSPYLEIYVPINNPSTGTIVAVGELYVDATQILADLQSFAQRVYLSIGLATLAVLGMLALSARQSELLRDLLSEAQRLAEQNEVLHLAAEQARVEASKSNEQTLNLIGAEIHDGPVQLLGLATLMTPKEDPVRLADGTTRSDLVNQAVSQLRKLSAGLILPELEGLDVQEVVDLAVSRHRALVGTDVALETELDGVWLDMPRRICLYRVIQEGLMNAARHGDGQTIRLLLRADPEVVSVSIQSQKAAKPLASADDPSLGLGLQGMRLRLAVFNGTATLSTSEGWTILSVTLPVSSAQSRPPDAPVS